MKIISRNSPGHLLMICAVATLFGCQPTERQAQPSASWALGPFVKVDSVNPVLTPGENKFLDPILKKEVLWDEKDVFNPAAVVRDNKLYLLFRAEDQIGRYAGTSRLGLASSDDGLHFTKLPAPVFFPAEDSMKSVEWEGGVEDPRLVEHPDGGYLLTYTAYDGKTARLCFATSPDLLRWTKLGTVLTGKYRDVWSKSGAIVAERQGERIVATKVKNEYWMYFGDTQLYLAHSPDLLHWSPILQGDSLKPVLSPRQGMFDSRLVESGPFALRTEAGIVLIYNSMNLHEGGAADPGPDAYSAGQALFDPNDPSQLIDRTPNWFMKPDRPYEINGQVNQVVFLEGLAWFHDQWFLYYGTADSRIAVAVSKP